MKHSVPLGLVSAESNGSTTKMSDFTYLTSNLTQGANMTTGKPMKGVSTYILASYTETIDSLTNAY